MEVFVVIREDQNDHGFVDTSVCGIYRTRADADACVEEGEAAARAEGFRVSGDANRGWDESDWQVYYKVEAHELK